MDQLVVKREHGLERFTSLRSELLFESCYELISACSNLKFGHLKSPQVVVTRHLGPPSPQSMESPLALRTRCPVVTVTLEPLDIAVNTNSKEEAIQEAVNEAVEYAREYLEPSNGAFYMRSPNRRPHLSTVLRIAICDSTREVLEVFNLA
jgi:hypothetical protein